MECVMGYLLFIHVTHHSFQSSDEDSDGEEGSVADDASFGSVDDLDGTNDHSFSSIKD